MAKSEEFKKAGAALKLPRLFYLGVDQKKSIKGIFMNVLWSVPNNRVI